jgi:CheY-like chemotaxis protein
MNGSDVIAGKVFLVVDDEELVREVTVMMIEDAGGTAITARDGAEAVKVFEQAHGTIAAVLMDFSMPHLNGYEAFERMQGLNPKVPVLLVSGLKITPEAETARASGRLGFINKPFKQDDLLAMVRKVLT